MATPRNPIESVPPSPQARTPLITRLLALAASLTIGFSPSFAADTTGSAPPDSAVETARRASDANPANAQLKFQYAETLRKAGRTREALKEFLLVTEIDPAMYVAYHQITLCSPDEKSLAEAVKRLTFLMTDKPKELMLRVALSELLECQGEYFRASRVLVDLVYENAVPPKYVSKVNTRIRVLQVKARGEHAQRKIQEHHAHAKTESAPPLPLPEENLSRGLSASRLEKAQEVDGFGHSLLQH